MTVPIHRWFWCRKRDCRTRWSRTTRAILPSRTNGFASEHGALIVSLSLVWVPSWVQLVSIVPHLGPMKFHHGLYNLPGCVERTSSALGTRAWWSQQGPQLKLAFYSKIVAFEVRWLWGGTWVSTGPALWWKETASFFFFFFDSYSVPAN